MRSYCETCPNPATRVSQHPSMHHRHDVLEECESCYHTRTKDTNMRIEHLTIENFKGVSHVEITPVADKNMIYITGKNGAGKSSVLDAFFLALAGGAAAKSTQRPIRDGEDHAEVTVDLGDLIVTRSWATDKPTKLKVTAKDGAVYKRPQEVLDALVGRLSFDPQEFARKDAKDQLATLLTLVELPFNVNELAAQRQGIYDSRTEVNRQLKEADARLSNQPTPDSGVPEVEVSSADVIAAMAAARETNTENDRKRTVMAGYVRDLDETKAATLRAQSALAAAQEALRAATAAEATALDVHTRAGAVIDGLVDVDLSTFESQLAELEQTNATIRAAAAHRQIAAQATELRHKSEGLTAQLADLDKQKAEALAAADMPIEGLSFDEHGVTFNGIPLSQCSAAEQWRVSIAIAIAVNPKLHVMSIRDGSLLDSDSLALVNEMAEKHDFQVWTEMVDESGEMGVVIQDGTVIGADKQMVLA